MLLLHHTGMTMHRIIVSGGFEPRSLEELTDSFLLAVSLYSVFKHLPPAPFRSARLSETGRDLLCLGGTEIRFWANGIDGT